MATNISVSVDDETYEKFQIAICLTKEEESEAFKHSMQLYIIKALEQEIERKEREIEYLHKTPGTSETIAREDYRKANRLIHKWAHAPTQINHKIIRSYFLAEKANGKVFLAEMERLCKDQSNLKLYVPTFKSNYAQMKLDAPKSHGRVFEDDGEIVYIWEEVKETLFRYKDFFTRDCG